MIVKDDGQRHGSEFTRVDLPRRSDWPAGRERPPEPVSASLPPPTEAAASIELLLLDWQTTSEPRRLETLIRAILPLVEITAASKLRRHHVADLSAIDDVVSLVFDHLRRLPGSTASEPEVAPFFSQRDRQCHSSPVDSGQAYVIWLTRERAHDVIRSRRRRSHFTTNFSQLNAHDENRLDRHPEPSEDACVHCESAAVTCTRLHDAVSQLVPRERAVIEMLLDGKTRAIVAHALDCCEGTVSRLRTHAIESLKQSLKQSLTT